MNNTTHQARHRLFAGMIVATLSVGPSLIGAVAPARAIPGATTVSTPSAATSSNKFAVATCPGSKVVHGASGRIDNGGGKVLITAMVPNAALRSVMVVGTENEPYAADWTVVATAICGPDNGHGLYRVEAPSPANGSNVEPRSAYANCDPGDVMFGTGFALSGGAGGDVLIAEVEPNTALDQVEVEARADNGTPVFDLSAIAICGTPAGSIVQLMSQSSPFGSAPTRTAETTTCPQGTVTGVGGKITDNTDGILLDRFTADSTLTRTKATARDNAGVGASYETTAFAICST